MPGPHIPVIITRAEPGASETASRLLGLSLMALKAPVMSVAPDASILLPDLNEISGLVFTSANGVRTFTERCDDRSLTAWCVGPATAAAAREARFEQVEESAGNARDLAAYIAAHVRTTTQPLLHIANAAARGDLKSALQEAGIPVKFCPLYKMVRASSLPEATLKTLMSGMPAIVLAHSEKGAEAFAELTKGLPIGHLMGVAISMRAASPLLNAGVHDVHIAHDPNEDGLFKSLKSAVATLSA